MKIFDNPNLPLTRKIDFALIIGVRGANPNGDPLYENRPRTDHMGHGEMSQGCANRKLRDRLAEMGHCILAQSNDRATDGFRSLRSRANLVIGKLKSEAEIKQVACATWFDTRTFGQLFAFSKAGAMPAVSIGITGPFSIHTARSIEPVGVTSFQITKSFNGESESDKTASDRMGMKHFVDNGMYVAFGGISPERAKSTGFSDQDAEYIKEALLRLFENDASSARPAGSMWVEKLVWWTHESKSGSASAHRVHSSLTVSPDGQCVVEPIDGVQVELLAGF